MVFAGLDIGSQSTCAIIINDKEIVAHALMPSGVNPKQIGKETLHLVLEKANLSRSDVQFLIATGYGRYQAEADEQVSEIRPSSGVQELIPEARMVLILVTG
jgi:activator of 2-hydroxyglutaryl-CoA dehydratase